LSERQMLASNLSLSVAFIGFIGATAVRKPSSVTPARSLFELPMLLSTLGQAAVHIWVLQHAVSLAKDCMGPAALLDLLEFQKWAKAQPFDIKGAVASGNFFSQPFKPNLLNSVIFCVEMAQGLALLLVNYKGRPWMKGATENCHCCLQAFWLSRSCWPWLLDGHLDS